jgi:FkbM family methyltransferase
MKWLRNYLRRPFPRSITEFKDAMVSYAQFGEDLLAQELLGYERSDVFYMDIGAFHPISKSNTYVFYQRGGRGICIEPNPEARALWQQFRPRDTFIGKGVTGGASGFLSYNSDDSKAGMNHFVEYQSNVYPDYLQLECVNIREIVTNLMTAGQRLDLLSIDCEGMDLEIIRSFPFDVVRPRVAIIEDFDYSEKSEISSLMHANGYKTVSYAKISKLFVDSRVMS